MRDEIGSAAQARPGLAQVASTLARNVLDNPRAVNQQAAAARTLAVILDKQGATSARGRRGHLAAVKSMTTSSPSA